MTTPRTLTQVEVYTSDGAVTVTGETTCNEHLVITPQVYGGGRGFGGGFCLTHRPTGLAVPTGCATFGDLDRVREFVGKVAHLDWSFTTADHLSTDAGRVIKSAVVQVEDEMDREGPDADEHATATRTDR
jgi:hypothetical protein